jgi:molybdopterin synthase catalytic subunit
MIKTISRPDCGGISIFQGITRNNFKGKKVSSLSYECYEQMALKEMNKIALEAQDKFGVKGVAMWHRIGNVPIEEASINIATIGEHRKECIKATEWCIDTLKARVPIWKKEFYIDDDGQIKEAGACSACPEPEWKQNAEFQAVLQKKKDY